MDTCPPLDQFFRPILHLAASGEINVKESRTKIADELGLSEQARLLATRSDTEKWYIYRINTAVRHLHQAGLLVRHKRGFVKITDYGSAFFDAHKGNISVEDIDTKPTHAELLQRISTRKSYVVDNINGIEGALTPLDRITEALEEIEDNLAADLLEQLQTSSPSFFEKVVVDLLLSMGYGGGDDNADHVIEKVGNDGVDGLINQDTLGLERVYIKAKHFKSENTISSDTVWEFLKAFDSQQTSKGLFVTTSSFSKEAITTAEKVPQRIVLIDGERLSRLMIKYDVGCVTQKMLSVKQLNADYFE